MSPQELASLERASMRTTPAAIFEASGSSEGAARRQRPRLDGKRRFHWRNAGTDVEESLRGPHWGGG